MSLESDIKNMVESLNLNLYDAAITTEGGETIYRISVTSAVVGEGISLDKCVEATKLISPLLDVTPPVSGDYRLEVSSPGIERKLKTIQHFANSIGEKTKITTFEKEKYRGTLSKVEGNTIIMMVEDDNKNEVEQSIEFADIVKASTYFEW
jgi:ribosome maturation factor RimP